MPWMNIIFLQRPRIENENKIIGDLLFNIWWKTETSLFEMLKRQKFIENQIE